MTPAAKRILLVTPRFPFGVRRGACEQDRLEGIRLLTKLGYTVRVITMCYPRHLTEIEKAEKEMGVTIIPVTYSQFRSNPLRKALSRVVQVCIPAFWDGASYEYRNPVIRKVLKSQLDDFRPNLVWFDYSNLWPLYPAVRKKKIPIVTRSINYEPKHYLSQSNGSLMDCIKYQAKVYGERRMAKMSNLIFSITPKEQREYETFSDTKVVNLPLRRLSAYIGKNRDIHDRTKLSVCFLGSNFLVPHMRRGLLFMLNEVNPLLQRRFPGTFTLHVIGGKNINGHDDAIAAQHANAGVVFHGFVPDLETVLKDMDIAVSPSLIGEGMQQKVFEPFVRGIPTIASARALSGYPLIHGVHLITPEPTAEAFVDAIGTLADRSVRARISAEAIKVSEQLFSEEVYLKRIRENLDTLLGNSV